MEAKSRAGRGGRLKPPMPPGRLVYLSDYFGPGGAATGGAGIAALESFEALAAMRARVQLVSGYLAPDAMAGREDVDLLGGEDLRARRGWSALKAVYNPDARRRLAPLLEDLDPATTVVVLHQWTRWLSPSALGLVAKFKLLVYMHDYFWMCPNGAYYNFREAQPCTLSPMGPRCIATDCDRAGYGQKLGRLARQAMKILVEGGDPSHRAFLHISELSRRTAAGLAPLERHSVVHNPLTLPPIPDPRTPEREVYDVGYFGRLEPEKGVLDLCEAVRRGGRRALFVGSGAASAEIVAALGPQAVVDWADQATAFDLMQRCRTIALPSRWPETWGLVTAEALASGRPVLVSSRAGSADLVRRFGGGLVFDPDRPGHLAARLQELLHGPPTPAVMARVARDVRRALAPETHGRRLVSLVADLWGLDVLAASRRSAGAQPAQWTEAL
jgi:glycosyltransferase involved in cell wall biosynthesis